MKIPKSKRRTITINDIKFEYCTSGVSGRDVNDPVSNKVTLYAKNLTTGEEINREWVPRTTKPVHLKPYHVMEILKGNYPNIYADPNVDFNILCPECGIELKSIENVPLIETIGSVGACPECDTILSITDRGVRFYSE